jgi:hypothetical protein
MKKIAIVAPVHIQVSLEWIKALKAEQDKADIIIVDDSDGDVILPIDWDVYDYERQKEALGDELYAQFEQFHKSSACKNFGTWLAYKKGYEVIIVIDSDCIVPEYFVQNHLNHLLSDGDGWDNPLEGTGLYSRGFPYSKRGQDKWCHMGLWRNELDLYGTDRVGKSDLPNRPASRVTESNGAFFPLSGMNVSFKREAIPYMLFLPNFKYGDYKFSRHDDIWGGYIFEKVSHAKNKSLSFGKPFVYHDTVVIPEEDAAEEVAMIKYEDEFYSFIDAVMNPYVLQKTAGDIFGTLHIMSELEVDKIEAFKALAPAFKFWELAFK